jgi:tetratricopeptide (TPR) repeat protein
MKSFCYLRGLLGPRIGFCPRLRAAAGIAAAALLALSCSLSPGEEELRRYVNGSELYGQGRFAEAVDVLGEPGRFPPALVLRAKAEYFSGNLEGAEKSCRLALRRRPGAVEARFYLARILREQGDAPRAKKALETLLADDPGNIRALRLAAELAAGEGKSAEAAALLDRAAELSAESAMVFLDRARLRWIAGRGGGALDDLGRARALFPWDGPVARSIEQLESRIKEASR